VELAGLYRDIVETSADAIWVFDVEGRVRYTNPALRRLLGGDRSEATGLTVFDTLDEEGRGQFAAHLEDLRRGWVNQGEVESMFVRHDGTSLWVTLSESVLVDEDGTRLFLHRMSDYSDRREAVDELSAAQRRLTEALRIARVGSWEWDVEADLLRASAELRDLYGMGPADVPLRYADFLAMVHDDDRASVAEAVTAAVESGGSFVFVARLRAMSGAWVWTRGRGVAVTDETGRTVSMYGTHQDITETKLAELALEDQVAQNTLLQAVASTANEATTLAEVLAHARDLVLLHDDWVRGRGFLPNDDRTDLEPFYVTDADRQEDDQEPEVRAAELELARRAFRSDRPVWDDARLTIAFQVSYGDEPVAVITLTSAPPLYRHELIESMVEQVAVQLGTVAERERVQRELADARDAAMEASRQKSEFLATMSHEIRTPLNGVIGLNDLLLRTRLDADQLRLASGVQVASRALLAVINDVLDFSKIEAGKLELEQLDFEVRAVFDQVASVLSEAARAKGLELMVSCHPDVPEVLAGDPTRLAQVLTNLGSNAVKFTESGEVRMRATADPTDDGRWLLHVSVCDTGVGVPEMDVATLFEAFTQADASTTRRFGGTGLGLAISKEIVHALGGEIGLEPNPGGGSTFWFTALLDPPAGTARDAADDDAREVLGGRRVLVVDDNPHNRLILEEQLAWWHLLPTTAASADEAEAALVRATATGAPFDAVLLDMSMPDRDGVDLARALAQVPAYSTVPKIMLTSALSPPAQVLEEVGIVECLTKPVLSADLRRVLLCHLAGRSALRTAPETASPTSTAGRVLVVEDNQVNQLVAVGLLDAFGYDSLTADDGRAALDVLAREPVDLVLMDVQMPVMDGYAATRALRAREGDGDRLPVVAMTAAAVEGERERCLAAGMDDFLTKPVDTRALAEVLERWLGPRNPGATPSSALPSSSLPTVSDHPEPPRGDDPALAGLVLERLDELRDLDPGNTAYLDRAIGNFVANTPETLQRIRQAVADGDAAAVKQTSHKLAGSALNLGVEAAGRTAQEIEIHADTGALDGVDALVDRLDRALAEGRSALRAYQATYAEERAEPGTTT
jgi:PAS domain S-box-containing protein